MASHRKLGPGRWQVRWVEPGNEGQRVQRSRVVSTAEARDELLRAVQLAEDLGKRYVPAAPRRAVPSIGDAMKAFLEDVQRVQTPGTLKTYREAMIGFLEYLHQAGLGHATVADLSRDMLTGYYAALEKGRWDRPRSDTTKRRIVEKVENAWRWLFDIEWHESVPRPKKIQMPSNPPRAVVAPSWDEMDACVLACQREGPKRLTTILRYTGLRVGQALAVTWADVDFKQAVLTVAPHKGLPGFRQPMSEHLAAELATWGEREGFVLTWRPVRQARERAVSEAWERAGVREAVWRGRPDQAFRRGIVTGLAAAGVGREAAELFIGHAVVGVRAHYLDWSSLPLRQAAAAIPKIGGATVLRMERKQ